MSKILYNGVYRDMTPEEQAQYDAECTANENTSPGKTLEELAEEVQNAMTAIMYLSVE